LLVGIAHVASGVGLYGGRVVHHVPVCDSDFIVFIAPAILAFVGYWLLAWFGRPLSGLPNDRRKMTLATLIAFVATLVSFECSGVILSNTWGT
jgi:hypothetical protein